MYHHLFGVRRLACPELRRAAAFAISAPPTNRYPDRSGPIFSSAPPSGASGRVVEGSLRRVPQVRFSTWVLGFSCGTVTPYCALAFAFGVRRLAAAFAISTPPTNRHPDRIAPIFLSRRLMARRPAQRDSCAYSAPRLLLPGRPVRFAGAEGSRQHLRVSALFPIFPFRVSIFEFRFSRSAH